MMVRREIVEPRRETGPRELRGLAPTSASVPVPLPLDGDRRQHEMRQSPTVR